MRFGFYTSLTFAAAASTAVNAFDLEQEDLALFAQIMGLDQVLSEEELMELAQLTVEGYGDEEMMNEYEFAEIGNELDDDNDDEIDFLSQIKIEDPDDLMFNEVAEFLAQISDEDKTTLRSLVGQVLA